MKTLLIASLLLSVNAFAHLKVGLYVGSIEGSDESCDIAIKEVRFKNNIKNPYNERVDVLTDQSLTHFTISHLPMIDVDAKKVSPEKGILSGVNADEEKTEAIKLEMIHSQSYSGPGAYHFISTNKNGETKYTHCKNLEFQP